MESEMKAKNNQTAQKTLGSRYAENPNDANYLIKVSFEVPLAIGSWVTATGSISNFEDVENLVIKGRGPVISLPITPGFPMMIPIISMKNMAFKRLLKKIPSCEELASHFAKAKHL